MYRAGASPKPSTPAMRPMSSPAIQQRNQQNVPPPPSPVTLQFNAPRTPQPLAAPPRQMKHQSPVHLSMYDRHRFMISNYPVLLVDFLKRFPGSVQGQVMGTASFHFPFKHYAEFVSAVRALNYERVFEIPQKTIAALCNPVPIEQPFDSSKLPAHLWETLFPFQRLGVEFIVNHNGRVLVADEMGLGKVVFLRFCSSLQFSFPITLL